MKNILALICFVLLFSCQQQMESKLGIENKKGQVIELSGAYLGQIQPDSVALLFAPGIVSNGLDNRDMTISPNGKEMYFSTSMGVYTTILFSEQQHGIWAKPEVASFASNPDYTYIEPCFSADGNSLFFATNQTADDTVQKGNFDIWIVNREQGSWSKARQLSKIINTEQGEFFPSLTNDGSLYFTRSEPFGEHFILRSRFIDGQFQEAEKLPWQVNCGKNRFNAFVSPDERFMIVPAIGMPDSFGGVDYYIVFRSADDKWSEPLNMGDKINTPANREWSASVSPDGNLLFFMSLQGLPEESQPVILSADFLMEMQTQPRNGRSDIYWINTDFLKDLENKAKWK